MRRDEILVVKYGSSVLRSPADVPRIADDILRAIGGDKKIIAVVSAFEGATEKLIAEARSKRLDAESAEFAHHVGAGEFESAKRLVDEIQSRSVDAKYLPPREFGFIAEGNRLDATPLGADPAQLLAAVQSHRIVVVPGYSAIDPSGKAILLGRGGSDLTAIQIAHSIKAAHARLVKDVDGVYDRDPNKFPGARIILTQSHQQALLVCGDLIQAKALEFAEAKSVNITVTPLGRDVGTLISSGP